MRAKIFSRNKELLCEAELQIAGPVTKKGTDFIAVLDSDAHFGVEPPQGIILVETETGERFQGFVEQSNYSSTHGSTLRGKLVP